MFGADRVGRHRDVHAADVREVAVRGNVPRDVDTWEDYEAVLAS